MTEDETLDAIIEAGEDILRKTNDLYVPYDKQKEFHALSIDKRQRLLSAGNQLGKTQAGTNECQFHATGVYPEWWTGRRFDHPVTIWVGGVTHEVLRDTIIAKLLGKDKKWGTASLHPDYIVKVVEDNKSAKGGVDYVVVKHISGGESIINFKAYSQGREKWQGAPVDVVWFDEEPPEDIYKEGLSRTNGTNGMLYLTFTPLNGMTRVAFRFFKEHSEQRALVRMSINDALHISEKQRKDIIESYDEHERKARVEGYPVQGSGAIFPVSTDDISCNMPELKKYWARLVGLDFGWDHPTAAVWLAWDRDSDIVYVYDIYRQSQKDILYHAAAIRKRGDWIPVAWPHDGLQHDKGSGLTLAEQYSNEGVLMLDRRATFEDGGHGVEAGVSEMLMRFQTGRLKIARHLVELFEEIELYHRKDGKIVKERDDLLSALRYAIMMLRDAVSSSEHDADLRSQYDEGYQENEDDRSDHTGY